MTVAAHVHLHGKGFLVFVCGHNDVVVMCGLDWLGVGLACSYVRIPEFVGMHVFLAVSVHVTHLLVTIFEEKACCTFKHAPVVFLIIGSYACMCVIISFIKSHALLLHVEDEYPCTCTIR